jgi:hypothetical protein
MIDENIQEKPSNVIDFTKILMPFIEEDVPLPRNAKEALPSMTSEDEVLLRAQTIKEISDITGEEIAPNAENIKDAEDLARKMIQDPSLKQEYGNYPNETIAYLAGLVGAHNHMIVKDLAELKLFVVNKLVEIVVNSTNPKEQIAALRSIGEVDGVDAFKKKTEITHITKTIEEVEQSLLKTLESIESKIVDVDFEEIIDDRTEEKDPD